MMKRGFDWTFAMALCALLVLLIPTACTPADGTGPSDHTAPNGNMDINDPLPACQDGEDVCEDLCTDTSTSRLHCGGCGVRCFPGQSCIGGHCVGVGALLPKELRRALQTKDFRLINVRVPPVGIIPGTDETACNSRPDRLARVIGTDRNARVVVYCRTHQRSLDAVRKLHARGYRSVSYLHGGVLAWQRAGYELD